MPQKSESAFKLILSFVFISILGLVPWEPLLSIQIQSNILKWLTSDSIGLIGLLGLIFTLIGVRRNFKPFFTYIGILLTGLSIPIAFILVMILVFPTFEWHDTYVYRNGNDYLIVQNFDSFATTTSRNPRVIRTTSLYGAIRLVEEQYELKDNDDQYGGKEVLFKGKIWVKQLLRD